MLLDWADECVPHNLLYCRLMWIKNKRYRPPLATDLCETKRDKKKYGIISMEQFIPIQKFSLIDRMIYWQDLAEIL